jgi:hypothetical protein
MTRPVIGPFIIPQLASNPAEPVKFFEGDKMKHLTLIATAIFVIGSMACQTTTVTNKPATNQPTANVANANQSPANQSTANTSETGTSTVGSLATPADAYKAAYAARQKKDVAALKKVLSADALDFFTEMGKEEKKSLDDILKELSERPQAKTAETRNEKIDGNKATLEYLDDKGNWSPMDFIKEGNDWKLTIPKFEDGPPKVINKDNKNP